MTTRNTVLAESLSTNTTTPGGEFAETPPPGAEHTERSVNDTHTRVRVIEEERRTIARLILHDVRNGANAEQHPLRTRLEELVHLGCDARANHHRVTP